MEFRVSNRLTGARQPTGSPENKIRPEKGASLGAQCRTDKLALSRQAVAILEERTRQEAQERARKQRDRMAGREESASSPFMAGDKVPPEDEKFLQESDPAGYQLAMAARKVKRDPKEWESALEKEEHQASGTSEGSGASAEGAEAVSGDCGDEGCST